MNYSEYVSSNITVECGDNLLPNYPLKNSRYTLTEEYIFMDEESDLQKEYKRKKLENREMNFSEGVDIFKDFQYLDIYTLKDDESGWNYFDAPNKMQFLNLISSIQNIGLFTPLVVQKQADGKFTVICGNSRAKALKELYKNTKNERFLYAPCFIVDENVEEYFIRSLIIDSNITYRTISRDTYMRAIFERAELLKRSKKYKNEINIAQTVADEFGVSKGTINNYLALKNLCKEAQTLLYKKELNLASAKQLAKFKPEDQLYILEHTSLDNLNEQFKTRVLTKNINLENPSQKDLDRKLDTIENIVPGTTSIRIDIAKESLNKFLNVVIDFKKDELSKFSRDKDRKYIKKNFKVTLKDSDMKLYQKKGIIDEALIKRACSVDYMEIMRG